MRHVMEGMLKCVLREGTHACEFQDYGKVVMCSPYLVLLPELFILQQFIILVQGFHASVH